jgi:hypothetical protein
MIDRALYNRFWTKVDAQNFQPDECWVWRGCILQSGHGQFSVKGKGAYAHRVSYEMAHGKIPPNRIICHKCNNPACVNPNHLYAGTKKSNTQDSINAGTFCYAYAGRGTAHPNSKLTDQDVRNIRDDRIFDGTSNRKLASKYGVSYRAITKIIYRETWAHV